VQRLRELFRWTGVAEPMTAAEEHQLKDHKERRPVPMTDRQFVVEAPVALAFAVLATVLAVGDHEGLDVPLAIVLVAALALIQRVDFEVGSGYTVPTQLVFVPMLFALPAGTIPSAVAIAMVLDRLPDVVRGRVHRERVLLSVSDAWFAVGPALVFAIAEPGGPDLGDAGIYVAALAAQFAFDGVSSAIRAHWGYGVPVTGHVRELRVVWIVDALLLPVGLMAAFAAAAAGKYAFLLVLPLAVLLRLFASERRARLQQAIELSSTYRRTALLLGDVIGDDDEYTGAHSQGVLSLALSVADELRVSADERQLVEFGALLHDVGKIVIPKAIINKAGPLDEDEWRVMKTHTIEGQRMLDRVGGSLRDVGIVVRASHESWDGTGYPDGLAGEQIPLAARIVACADAFSAMTTDRSYRRALHRDDAIEELRRNAGTQFDPRVVDATIVIVERFGLPRRSARATEAVAG
jgi:putative nucleotidyltransferase with HDIG domain